MRMNISIMLSVLSTLSHASACPSPDSLSLARLETTSHNQVILAKLGSRIQAISEGAFVQFEGTLSARGRLKVRELMWAGVESRPAQFVDQIPIVSRILGDLKFTPATRNAIPIAVSIVGHAVLRNGEPAIVKLTHYLPELPSDQITAPQMIGSIGQSQVPKSQNAWVFVVLVDPSGKVMKVFSSSPAFDPDDLQGSINVSEADRRRLLALFDKLTDQCFIPGERDGSPALLPFIKVQ